MANEYGARDDVTEAIDITDLIRQQYEAGGRIIQLPPGTLTADWEVLEREGVIPGGLVILLGAGSPSPQRANTQRAGLLVRAARWVAARRRRGGGGAAAARRWGSG